MILGLSLVFGLIILIGYLAIESQHQETEKQITTELETVAQLKAKTITDWYHERYSDAEVAMVNQIPSQYLYNLEVSQKYDVSREDLIAWLDSLVASYDYRGIILLNRTGEMVISVPDTASVSGYSSDTTLKRALDSDTPLFTDIFKDPESGIVQMEFWVPVRLRPGERSLGVLVFQIDPGRYLFPLIQTWPTPTRSAESLIVRLVGDEVLFLNDLRHVPNASLSLSIPASKENVPAVMAAKGYKGIVRGDDYRGVPVVASITNISDTPWFIVAKIDQDEIYAHFTEFSRFVMGGIVLLLCIAGLGVLIFWKTRENEFISHQLQQQEHELFLAERIRLLMQQANDPILILDKDWYILEVNDAAVSMYGYSPDELKGKKWFDLRSEAAKKDIPEDLIRLSQTNSLILTTEHQKKDGTPFPVEDSIRIIDIQGTRYIQAIIRDLSERKAYETELLEKNTELYAMNEELSASYEEMASQQEELRDQMEMLRQSERELTELNHRLNEAQRAGHVGIWEYYIKTGKVWATQEALRIYGLPPVPDGMHDITEILDCIPDRERISTAIHDLIERNIPFDTTYRIHPADGSEDRYLSSIGELHYDEEGKPVKVFGVIQDITEKYLLMEDLRQNQEKLSALFNSRILGSVFSDIHGSIFEANDEFLRIIGYTREEFLRDRVKWTDITPPEYHARDAEAITEAQQTGVCSPYEKQYIRKDGSRIWVLTGYVLLGDAREEAVAFVLDISTSKANEERIQSLNLELEERVIERTNQLQFINEELQAEVEERLSAEKKLFETLSVLSATIESTPDGILVVDNNRNISVYNKIFEEMWQIPDSVLRLRDERVILKEQASRVQNPDHFCSRIAEIYQNPELDSFDVIELADNRILERTSRPQRIEYTIVGRVFSFRDVTKQKEMEEQIATSLREKEILLKEIHHRVKNNMQVVSSLLFMQARSTQQPEVRDILLESQNRIRSIALVHEKLYQSEDFKRIDYKDYLEKIAHHIFESYQISPGSIHLDVRSEDVFLSIEKAVPLSLIINELITNSIKHAFPKGLSGEIRIDFSLENSRYRLIYQDSGPGIPDKGAIEKPDTLGMQLIRGLAGQLNGTVRYETYQGFGYIIEFPA